MNKPSASRGPAGGAGPAGVFHGREHELHEIAGFLRGNQSVSIVGPRGIGKSSLLLHLMRPETTGTLQIGNENLFVYVDCRALNRCRHDEIFGHFSTEAAAAVRNRKFPAETALRAATSEASRSSFEVFVRALNERGLRLILMLDNFEQLTQNPYADVSLYNALHSAASRLRLVFLTASAQPLIELTYSVHSQKALSSPFFNIFAQLFLGLLSGAEARTLIRATMQAAGIAVSSQREGFLYGLAGGHPAALQIACLHASSRPDDLQEIEARTKHDLAAQFLDAWQALSSAEQEMLRHPSEAALHEGADPTVRSMLRSLTRKCLLARTNGSYVHPSKAWGDFVSTQPLPIAGQHSH